MKNNNKNVEQELSKSEIEMIDWMVKMVNEGKISMSEILQMIKNAKQKDSKNEWHIENSFNNLWLRLTDDFSEHLFIFGYDVHRLDIAIFKKTDNNEFYKNTIFIPYEYITDEDYDYIKKQIEQDINCKAVKEWYVYEKYIYLSSRYRIT